MIIKNEILIGSIERAIEQANFHGKNLQNVEYLPEDEQNPDCISISVPEETLAELEGLEVNMRVVSGEKMEDDMHVKQENVPELLLDLSQMLDSAKNLENFGFKATDLTREDRIAQINLSFLEHINEGINFIDIRGVDFSQAEPRNMQSKFKNASITIKGCNWPDINLGPANLETLRNLVLDSAEAGLTEGAIKEAAKTFDLTQIKESKNTKEEGEHIGDGRS